MRRVTWVTDIQSAAYPRTTSRSFHSKQDRIDISQMAASLGWRGVLLYVQDFHANCIDWKKYRVGLE